MDRSTPPNKTSHRAAAAATASLPFSIDHILSSPIKQAAVQAAVNQQQAAAMMMMNSQDVSQAMLNEQLALLGQQQHHLINPAALAAAVAAGAQHQQLQHWQQQQLMAAAAAANLAAAQQQQQQTALSPMNSMNPLAAASAQNPQSSPNFLSYFMAYMLLQQQQQQHPHHHHHHQLHQLTQNQAASLQQHRQPNNHLTSSIGEIGASSIGNNGPLKQLTNKSSIYDSIAALNRKSPPPLPILSHSVRESRPQRDPSRPSLSSSQQSGQCSGRKSNNTRPAAKPSPGASGLTPAISIASTSLGKSSLNNNNQLTALSSLSNFVTESLAPILNGDSKPLSKEHGKFFRSSSGTGGSQAFNSADLTFNKSNSPTTGSRSSNHNGASGCRGGGNNNNGNISQHRKSGSMEPEEAARSTNNSSTENGAKGDTQPRNATLDLISSAAQALKGAGTTINTTLAKAPPELVQKQPAWVFCTRYSDRPSSGPRTRRAKSKDKKAKDPKASTDEKRPRTAFTSEQLEKLRQEFQANSYLDERRRKDLAERLCLNENQIKIWFQNKRAKMKKQNNQPNPLRGLLVAGGLYNHSTATSDCSESYANGNDHDDDDDDDDDGDDEQGNNCVNDTIGEANNSATVCAAAGGANKKRRNQQDGNLNYGNDHDTGMRGSPTKRARLNHSGSESESNSSRLEDLEEDERVISVS